MINARLEELRSKFQENPRRYFAPYANELRKGGDPTQAISVCRTHLATQPGHVSGHIVLGQALYEAGEAAEARDVFTAALELDPENLIALRTLGEISQVNGEFSSARQWYERLLEADPRNIEVAQLVKDLPTEDNMAVAEPVEAPAAETTLAEHQQDHSPYAPPVATPTFHSGFTGPGPKYQTAEDIAEEERKAGAAASSTPEAGLTSEAVDFVEMDAAPVESDAFAGPQSDARQDAAEQPQTDTIDMVDFDSFAATAETTNEAAHEPVDMSLPDESSVEMTATAEALDFSLLDSVAEPTDQLAAAPPSAAEIEISAAETEQPGDHPRAMFAERGFDGPAADDIGWMMTPSAVESEPESAPEDWFDVPAAEIQEDAARPEEVQPIAAASPDQATDAWFDDVSGSAVVEPTEGVTSDDFWLPPDLGQIRTTPASEGQSEPEAVPAMETHESDAMPAMASAEESSLEPVAEAAAPDPVAEETIAEVYPTHSFAEAAYEQPRLHEDIETGSQLLIEAGEAAVLDHGTESAAMEAEFSPASEAMEHQPDHQEPTSSIEYFDHNATVEAADESYQATPAEWFDPFANRETEPYAEAVPESPAVESGWDASDLESTPVAEVHEAEVTEPVASEPMMVEPMSVELSEGVAAEYAPSDTFAADIASPETYSAAMAPTEPFSAAPDESLDAESFSAEMATPDESKYAEPVVSQSATTESSAPSTPAPFITETLAELYLQQGFRDEAVSIYRQLIEREPANTSLRDRLAAIERKDSDQRAAVPQPAAADRSGSQSVRTFFSKIARRPAANPASAPSQMEAAPQGDVPFASAASALANLFAGSKPTAEDEGAASNLANAYGNTAGRPSRAADRELSLDHLFRDVPPGGSPTGGMSLDEFYSAPNAETGSSTEPGEAGETPESGGADIRQFTAWLEGLRKK